jgi:WD40 repeat protein
MKRLFVLLIMICVGGIVYTQPVLKRNTGHTSFVNYIEFSSNGKYMISSSFDNTMKLWDVKSGKELRTFSGHEEYVYMAKLSTNGKYAASGGYDNFRVWDVSSGKEIFQLQEHSSGVKSVAWHPQGRFVAYGDGSGTIRICDIIDQRIVKVLNVQRSVVIELWYSNDGKSIYSCGRHEIIKSDVEKGSPIYSIEKAHSGQIGNFVLNNDESKIVSGGEEGDVCVWNAVTGEAIQRFNLKTPISSVAINNDENFIVATGIKGYCVIIDAKTGATVKDFSGGHTSGVNLAIFSKDQNHIMTCGDDQNIILYSIEHEKILREYNGLSDWVLDMDINPLNNQVISARIDKSLKLWELKSGKTVQTYDGHSGFVSTISYCKNPSKFVSGSSDKTAKLWATETKQVLKKFPDHEGYVFVDAHPIKSEMVTGSEDRLRTWDFNGKLLNRFVGHRKSIQAVAYSPDGSKILSGGTDNVAILWDANSGEEIWQYNHPEEITAVAFSPDGKYVVSCSGDEYDKMHRVVFHDLDNGVADKSIADIKKMVYNIVFSPDSKSFVVCSEDPVIKLYTSSSLKPKLEFQGHEDQVRSAFFTEDGKYLVSGSADGSCKIWDAKKGELLATRIASKRSDDYIVYTPEKYYTVSKEGTSFIHYVDGDDTYSFDQFDLQYNRPDKVMEKIGLAEKEEIEAYKNAYYKRLRKMGFDPKEFEKTLTFNVPKIEILSEVEGIGVTKVKEYTFEISATDDEYNLERLIIQVNGVPFYGIKGKSLKDLKTKSIKQKVSLQLTSGVNTITASVINEKGVESLARSIDITYMPEKETSKDLYIVSIGVSNFIQSEYNLTYAAKDAKDIINTFKLNNTFAKVYELPFLDENATKNNILKAKETLKNSKADDMVVLFVASHGLLDDEMNYYLATHDVDFNNPSASGILYDELESLFDGISARKKLMFIDACHSGEVDKDEMKLADAAISGGAVKTRGFKVVEQKDDHIGIKNSFELMKELFADLRRGTGAVVISSAGGAEFAFESSEWKNGVFTYALLEGLKTGNADADKNGEVLVSELRDYVFDRVKKLTNGQQNPTSRRENLEFDFRVW